MSHSEIGCTVPREVELDFAVTVTEQAAIKIFSLMEEEGDLELKLRIAIKGGGCSGFEYQFSFENEVHEGDTITIKDLEYQKGQVTVLVDPISISYLSKAEVDYVEDTQGARFIIRNPNASTTCGCGSSFSI